MTATPLAHRLAASLKAWAPLIASGHEVPDAAQVMLETADMLLEQASEIDALRSEIYRMKAPVS